jgi:peptidoglycan/LPS O-acetylase OafA/YrhL
VQDNSGRAVGSSTLNAPHIPELDGVRGVAILLVMIGHGWPRFSLLAVSGVGLFFVLSGFLITRILLKSVAKSHYFKNFYIRRALRIWPLYYLILGLAYLTPIFSFSHVDNPAYRFFLYIQNFWPLNAPPILGATWSLAIEEQFYLVWPLVAWFCRTPRRLGLIAATLILITPAIRTAYYLGGIDPYALTLGRLDGLATGAALATLTMVWSGNSKFRLKLIAVCLTLSVILLPLLHFTLLRKAFKDTSMNFAFVGLVAFAIYWSGSQATRVLRSAVLRFFGKVSYCAYLVHLALIYRLGSVPVVVRLAVAIAIATASWYLFESPLLRLKDSLTRGDVVEKKATVGDLVTQ